MRWVRHLAFWFHTCRSPIHPLSTTSSFKSVSFPENHHIRMVLDTIPPLPCPWHWFSRVFMKERRIQEFLALKLPETLSLVCVRNDLMRFPQWPINLVFDFYEGSRYSQCIAGFSMKRLTTTYWVSSKRLCFQIRSRAIPR